MKSQIFSLIPQRVGKDAGDHGRPLNQCCLFSCFPGLMHIVAPITGQQEAKNAEEEAHTRLLPNQYSCTTSFFF